MAVVKSKFKDLILYRREKNLDMFCEPENSNSISFYIQAQNGIVMKASASIQEGLPYVKYCNKAINFESLMIESHGFTSDVDWGLAEDGITKSSKYTLTPYEGYKLIITSLVSRVPSNVNLSANPMRFKVFKSYDGVTPVDESTLPAIDDTYDSLLNLVSISNSQLGNIDTLSGVFYGNMLELKFRYADSDMNNFSKLNLNSRLNERIEISLTNDEPIKDSGGATITDPCYCIFNTKRVLDF